MDDGNFHIVLENAAARELKLIHDIPVCCKISLEGQSPPLHIKVTGAYKSVSLNAYASYKVSEPSMSNSDQQWFEIKGQYMMRVQGERGNKPNIKVFSTNYLYVTFIASQSTTIEVRPQFIDPSKAQSLKYVTAAHTNKMDSSNTGVDEPKIPPKTSMIADFKKSK